MDRADHLCCNRMWPLQGQEQDAIVHERCTVFDYRWLPPVTQPTGAQEAVRLLQAGFRQCTIGLLRESGPGVSLPHQSCDEPCPVLTQSGNLHILVRINRPGDYHGRARFWTG